MKSAGVNLGSTIGLIADDCPPEHAATQPHPDVVADASTRDRVARSILQHGPSTAAQLATRLGLTPAAVRRHLVVLTDVGHLAAREQRVYGQRGRGRPAKVFALTDRGREVFYQAYDELAISALRYLAELNGPGAVEEFAARALDDLEERFRSEILAHEAPEDALVESLNNRGFVASVQPVLTGVQICQYHCPVAHVAREFPELCAAETRLFAHLLGSHVQRLATIAHGDGVCTTHIPHPVERKVTA